MAFTESKQKTTLEFIDNATSEYLDVYVRAEIKAIAAQEMNKTSSTAQQVADAVYDIISKKYSGDLSTALVCQQMYPKMCLHVLRNEIIKTLNA